MTAIRSILAVVIGFMSLSAVSQTAEELVGKNLQAKGGVDKIKAIKSVRMTGNFDAGGFKATVGELSKRPDMVKETFSLQGMTQVQAYDGSSGWQISPFGGRKDPEMLGEDDVRGHREAGEQPGQLVGAGQAGVRAGLAAFAVDPAAREGELAGRRPYRAVDEVEQGGLA